MLQFVTTSTQEDVEQKKYLQVTDDIEKHIQDKSQLIRQTDLALNLCLS